MSKFWMVWHVNGEPPRFKHPSEDSAIREAERLAKNNPGSTFVVLEATKARRVETMLRFDLSAADDSDIPF